MNILHVLSQFEVTGAEVYAAVLARRQAKEGHTIFIVSDTFTLPFPGTYLPHPIGKRSYPRRFRSIMFLVRLIRREKISVIHAHSRAASWVSFFASLITRTPLVSTVHGRQHLHGSLRLLNVYGRHVIAVSRNLREHLTGDLGMPDAWVNEIPNGITIPPAPARKSPGLKRQLFGRSPKEPVLLFVGRLTGPKGDVVRFLIRHVMPALLKTTAFSLEIIGGEIVPSDIPQLVRSANLSFGREAVTLRGFRTDIRPFFTAADVVIGSGRVALEALLAGAPTLGFGESGYVGRLTPATVHAAAESNFGDTGLPCVVEKGRVVGDILRALHEGEQPLDMSALLSFVRTRYDIGIVEPRVASVYRRALHPLPLRSKVPVLMYHRVVEEPPTGSRHGIWVSAGHFEAQLLSLKTRGYTPVTLRQYRDSVAGDALLPSKPVILTFDDGYEDNYTVAFPLLQKHGMPAVVFPVADFSRRTNFWDSDEPPAPLLKRDQIREMDKHGIEFGSHTLTHPHLPRISLAQASDELISSRKALEDVTGGEILALAYPYGELNSTVKETLRDMGYAFGVATNSGPFSIVEDPLEIRRIQVFPGTDRFGFWKKTHPWYPSYRSVKEKSSAASARVSAVTRMLLHSLGV